jgi:hydrogenase maturation protease
MPDRVRIIGVGSPFGDDRLGWVAAESLQRSPVLNGLEPGRIVISILDRPGTVLLTHCREADHVIVMDAVRSGAAPGTRHRFTASDVTVSRLPATSHGFGLLATLELGRVLGDLLPQRLLLCGIEIGVSCSSFGLSDAVAEVMPIFVGEIEKEALALANSAQ